MGKTTANLHASNLQCGHSNRDMAVHLEEHCTITTFSENKILKFCLHVGRATTSINLKAVSRPKRSGKFFFFVNISTVAQLDTWILLVCLQKHLRIFYFEKTLWLDNLLPSVSVWFSALQCTTLVLMVFLPTVMLLKWFSVYRLLAAATQINAYNQKHN